MTNVQNYTWWILFGLGVIGLTWLPVYGVEQGSGTSPDVQESSLSGPDSPDPELGDSPGTTESEKAEAKSAELTLAEQLEVRAKELEERDRALAAEEQRLETLRKDLEALAQEHAEAIAEAAKFREAQKAREKIDPTEQSLVHLIKVYDAMDPEDAAVRLEKMKEPLALDILAGIKEKKAASMLAGIEPGKAAKLTEGLRKYGKKKKTDMP